MDDDEGAALDRGQVGDLGGNIRQRLQRAAHVSAGRGEKKKRRGERGRNSAHQKTSVAGRGVVLRCGCGGGGGGRLPRPGGGTRGARCAPAQAGRGQAVLACPTTAFTYQSA